MGKRKIEGKRGWEERAGRDEEVNGWNAEKGAENGPWYGPDESWKELGEVVESENYLRLIDAELDV